MTLRISNVRLSVDEPEAHLPERLAAVLGVSPGDLLRWRILRKSLDARDKDALQFVYTAEVAVPDEEKRLAGRAAAPLRPASIATTKSRSSCRRPGRGRCRTGRS